LSTENNAEAKKTNAKNDSTIPQRTKQTDILLFFSIKHNSLLLHTALRIIVHIPLNKANVMDIF
jgi:hypothetical protein